MSHPGLQYLHLGCGESLNCELLKGFAFRSRGIFGSSVKRYEIRKKNRVRKTRK